MRAFLLETQRALAARSNVLMDGRDIGTVVLPDATVKIFLTRHAGSARAAPPGRAAGQKGRRPTTPPFWPISACATTRTPTALSPPLRQAADAVLLDTSAIDLEESYALLKKTVLEQHCVNAGARLARD